MRSISPTCHEHLSLLSHTPVHRRHFARGKAPVRPNPSLHPTRYSGFRPPLGAGVLKRWAVLAPGDVRDIPPVGTRLTFSRPNRIKASSPWLSGECVG